MSGAARAEGCANLTRKLVREMGMSGTVDRIEIRHHILIHPIGRERPIAGENDDQVPVLTNIPPDVMANPVPASEKRR
ncbi:MAG: hypothetical protein MRJ92_10445 [Nitrospira sp.]|nr:hypothetical protein [Nitrospira sp.]